MFLSFKLPSTPSKQPIPECRLVSIRSLGGQTEELITLIAGKSLGQSEQHLHPHVSSLHHLGVLKLASNMVTFPLLRPRAEKKLYRARVTFLS